MKTFNNATMGFDRAQDASVDLASPSKSRSVARIIEFDYLRGIAIVFIVLGHSVTNFGHGFPLWLANLLVGGTGVFVFISGFFFHHVFAKKFDYQRFMSKKVQNVFVPFLVVSACAIVVKFCGAMLISHMTATEALAYCWKILQSGYVLFPHWYIPYIMVTFLCAGLHFRYLKLSVFSQVLILAAFAIVAVVIHRPVENINVLQSVVYFTPFYLMGMLYSQHLEWFKKSYRYLFVIASILVVVTDWLQSSVFVHNGAYQKMPFTWAGLDLQFFQKVGLCILLVGLCSNWINERVGKHLIMLASISFAIFFLHPFLALIWGDTIYLLYSNNIIHHYNSLSFSLGVSALQYLFLMYGTVWVIKKIKPLLGKKSRLIIGA